jgi:pyruvate dehydrogenase E2 component (dihydrolipoamide acetyltransferase)
MADVITMPRLSDTMEEGTIVEWFKQVGDEIAQGDILAEVETDKANMELESFYEGKLLYVGIEQGDVVPVDKVIAVVGEEGENYKAALQSGQEAPAPETGSGEAPAAAEPAAATAEPDINLNGGAEANGTAVEERLKASPLARKLAEEKGIDLRQIEGSGDNGRIIKRDIERIEKEEAPAKEQPQPAQAPAQPQPEPEPQPTPTPQQPAPAVPEPPQPADGQQAYEDVPLSQMRKTIAKRLSESKFTAPHFYLTMEINMDQAMAARKKINELADVKTSFNDLIVKAASAALSRNPRANASWLGDKIRYYKQINTGVAIAVEEGLVVPVIRNADQKGISDIAKESQAYAERAQSKQLQPEDFEGNTFTVSNLGMYGIDQFTAIINSPDSCILAVGAIKQQPTVVEGELQETNTMTVTLSCDHRVVDGAIGAQFLKTFREYLEDPFRMLI